MELNEKECVTCLRHIAGGGGGLRGRYWERGRVDDRRRDVLLLYATSCDRLRSNWSSMSPQCDQIPERLIVSKTHENLC